MSNTADLDSLIGNDLAGFKIVQMTEVYTVDDDGRKSNTVGFFANHEVAEAFIPTQRDADWHKTGPALVLTNGKIGFLFKDQKPVRIFDEKEELPKIRKVAIEKLTPAQRRILGLK